MHAGKGLDNPKGEYNCFLNVIIQSLWQLEGFRDNLTEMAELRKHSESGRDNLALLKSMAHVFQMLSGTPVAGLRNATPASLAPASEGSGGAGAWGKASPGGGGAWGASGGGGAWGAGGMGGRNLFVVDPAQCRAALSSIFSEQGRSQVCLAFMAHWLRTVLSHSDRFLPYARLSFVDFAQVNEMADASEALADVLEALNRAFKTHKASGDDPSVHMPFSASFYPLAVGANISASPAALRDSFQSPDSLFAYVASRIARSLACVLVRQAGESLISSSFALHYDEDMECEQCRYKMAQQKNNTFFHLAFPSQLTEVQNTSSHRVAALRPISFAACAYMQPSPLRHILMAAK